MAYISDLPYHDLPCAAGLVTNYEPEEIAGRALKVCQNLDSYGRFRTLGVVPGSSDVVSADAGAAINSLHHIRFTDLDGVRKRHQLAIVSANLQLINVGSSFTALTTSADLGAEAACEAIMLDRLHISSPGMTGPTGGKKYDGTRVTNWGIVAPGLTPTTVLNLDSASGWSDSIDATSSTDTSVKQQGAGSIALAKGGTSSTQAYTELTGQSIDVSGAGSDIVYLWVFLPSGVLQQLATSGSAVKVTWGNSGLGNSDEHDFTVGEMLPGWNLLSIATGSPDSTNGSGATLSAIDTIRFELTTSGASETFSNVRFDHVYYNDEGAPTAATGGAGNVNAAVTYRVSYVTEYGVESNLGPASSSVTPSNEKVNLTNVPTSGDAQVIARRIYRDLAGDAIYRFVGQIDDNVTTTFTDNVAEASLGGATAPIAGDSLFDSSPPPEFAACAVFGRRVYGVDAENRRQLYISDVNAPEQFKLIDVLTLEDEIATVEVHALGLLAFSRNDRTFLISGDGITRPFRADVVNNEIGANGMRSVARAKGIVFVQHEAEMYLVASPDDPWFINGEILDNFVALTSTDLVDSFMLHDRKRQRILFFPKDSDTVYVWQYGTSGARVISGDGGGVDPKDLRQGSWKTLELPDGVDPQCAIIAERSEDLPEVWVGGNDGRVYYLQDPAATTYANDGATEAIAAEAQWHAVPLAAGPNGRGVPRFLELDAETDSGDTATVTVEILDAAEGAVLATKSWDVTLATGAAKNVAPVPHIGRHGAWCRVKVALTAANTTLKRVRLYYFPRAAFKGE